MDKIIVTVCAGTTCVVMGGSNLMLLEEDLPEALKNRVVVKGARCLGLCTRERADGAPYVKIDDEVMGAATVPRIIERLEALEQIQASEKD